MTSVFPRQILEMTQILSKPINFTEKDLSDYHEIIQFITQNASLVYELNNHHQAATHLKINRKAFEKVNKSVIQKSFLNYSVLSVLKAAVCFNKPTNIILLFQNFMKATVGKRVEWQHAADCCQSSLIKYFTDKKEIPRDNKELFNKLPLEH